MNYEEYLKVVMDKYEREAELFPSSWVISKKILNKVSLDGDFKPFYGYTSVFRLGPEGTEKCVALSNALCREIGNLIVLLPVSTYHITLHTFWNQNNSGSKEEVDKKMEDAFPRMEKAFADIRAGYNDKSFRMKALGITSDGSDVVSIKFIPADEESFNLLYPMFVTMEEICPIGQFYHPHISLGYFKVKNYSDEEIKTLFCAIQKYSMGHEFIIDMKVKDLVAESHDRMDNYSILNNF